MELEEIKTAVREALHEGSINTKKILTFDECVRYTGYSPSYLYKLTSTGQIPFHKPSGKMIFFDREEVEKWILNNAEYHKQIEDIASTYITLKR